jgi:hypothetical protein
LRNDKVLPLSLGFLYVPFFSFKLFRKFVNFSSLLCILKPLVVELLLNLVVASIRKLIMIKFKSFVLMIIVNRLSIVEQLR